MVYQPARFGYFEGSGPSGTIAPDPRRHCARLVALGLPTEIEGRQVVLVTGGLYGAVTMPAGLGEHVRAQLQLLAGPIVAWTLPDWQELWVFLVRTNCFPQGYILEDLTSAGAVICPPGTTLRLPDLDETGAHRWINPPTEGRGLPQLSLVVTAIRLTALRTG